MDRVRVRPFIVWTLRRTGGTNLTKRLVELSGMASAQHEPFNAGRTFGRVTRDWIEHHDRTLLDASIQKIAESAVIIKHCVEVVPQEISESLAIATTRQGYRHLFLYRRNALDRLLSLHFAERTGIWGPTMTIFHGGASGTPGYSNATAQALAGDNFVESLSVEQLVEEEKRSVRLLTKSWETLRALGADPIALAYEDVYRVADEASPLSVLAPVLGRLGMTKATADLGSWVADLVAHGEQGTRDQYRCFPGVEELAAAVGSLAPFSPKVTGDFLCWRSTVTAHPWILRSCIDKLPDKVGGEPDICIGGFTVLSRKAPDGLRLELDGEGQTIEMNWGEPSPHLEQQYSEAKNAAHARWSGPMRFSSGGRMFTLNLTAPDGPRLTIGEILRIRPIEHTQSNSKEVITGDSRPLSAVQPGQPAAADLRARVLGSLLEFRESLKQHKKALGSRAMFILEKPAPALKASALVNCRVFPNRITLLESIPSGGVVAEVGTQYGNWASTILSTKRPDELHLFDLSFELLREDVRKNARVNLHKGDSSKNLALFVEEYFDWIYIDGDHSYDGVNRDIRQAVKKVKSDGILIFNDYTRWSPMEAIPYGVVTAVNELINRGEWEMVAVALAPDGYWDVALKRVGKRIFS